MVQVDHYLTMKMDGPYQPGSGDMFYYLKKRWALLEQGVFVQPNPSYIHKMVELLQLQNKKHKSLPHHSTLEVSDKASSSATEFLNGEDRPDIQQA